MMSSGDFALRIWIKVPHLITQFHHHEYLAIARFDAVKLMKTRKRKNISINLPKLITGLDFVEKN